MTNGNPHNMPQRLKSSKSKIEESGAISSENKQLIRDFLSYLNSQDLSDARKTRHLQCIKLLAEHIDYSFKEIEKKDVVELVGDMNKSKIKDQELADSTKAEYRKSLIKFFTDFLESMKYDIETLSKEFDGEQLKDFFISTSTTKKVDPGRLPTPTDSNNCITITIMW